MSLNFVASLIFCDLVGKQRTRNVDVAQFPARSTVNVIVPLGAAIEATGLIPEWKLKNHAAFGERIERSIDGPN